jgi:hypothetical protein
MHQKKVIGEKRFSKNDFLGLLFEKTPNKNPKKVVKSSWNVVTS